MTRDELIKHLTDFYQPDDPICAHIWTRQDVYDKAEEMDVEIDSEEARAVLDGMERAMSSEYGVTWDDVELKIAEVKEGRGG